MITILQVPANFGEFNVPVGPVPPLTPEVKEKINVIKYDTN